MLSNHWSALDPPVRPVKANRPPEIELKPGTYEVTLNGPNDKSTTFDVQIEAGKRVAIHKDTANVDFGQLEKEIQQP